MRNRLAQWLRLVAWVAALSACGPAAPDPPAVRNVVLISIDTLRADHLGAYGHERDTSPHLDRFAAQGVLFEQASSTAPWTLPAHVSMLTGLFPSGHGVRHNLHRLPGDVPSLPEWLAERGFDTGAFVNAYFMEPLFGLDRGFQTYEVFAEDQSRGGATLRVLEAAESWLSKRGEAPFFLLVHLFDVHSSYHSEARYEQLFTDGSPQRYSGDTIEMMMGIRGDVPLEPADARHLAALYDAGIRQLDEQLAGFLGGLNATGPAADTLVVVTSDHGEEFLEHGGLSHGTTHYDEVLRVPLLVVGPGVPRGRRVGEPVSLVDLQPTVLDLLGIEPFPSDGRSLLPTWRDETGPGKARALLAETGPMEDDALRSLRRGSLKLIEDRRDGSRRLYDLTRDPREQRDLAAERPEAVAELAAELDRLTRSPRRADTLDPLTPEATERLRSLGYLAP